jgi:hypothetical protein
VPGRRIGITYHTSELASTSSWFFGIDLFTKVPVDKESAIEVMAGRYENVARADVAMEDPAGPVGVLMS